MTSLIGTIQLLIVIISIWGCPLWKTAATKTNTNTEGESNPSLNLSPPTLYNISNKSFYKLAPKGGGKKHTTGDSSSRNKRDVTYNVGTVVEYTTEEKDNIQQRHVTLRGQVSPEASNMEYMYWDDDLATMGEQWSSACLWEHGQPDNISPYSSLGQNLWLGTGSLAGEPDPVPAINAWYNEDQYYDYDTTSCSGVCGHYTQVVWASSMYVGCGKAFCESVSDGQYNNAWIVTCNYAPAGNYAGTQPYKSGASCTQCDSGVGTCHTNQCRNCTADGVSCDCNAVCYNCGTLTSDCTCVCQTGWYGSDCSTECVDTHQNCWQNPGWPGPQYCDYHPAIPIGCPLMCSVCEAATGEEVCDDSTSTVSVETEPAGVTTSGNNVEDDSTPTVSVGTDPAGVTTSGNNVEDTTTSTTTSPTTQLPTTQLPTTTEAPVCGGISQECENGGTFVVTQCSCECTTDYQGEYCQNSKEEAQYGVLILFIDDINNYDTYKDWLRSLIAYFLTEYCNDNVETCCGVVAKTPTTRRYSFVTAENVVTALGYPYDHDTRNDAYWTMFVVTVPAETDLCVNGTVGSSSRRKRDAVLMISSVLSRIRRQTDSLYLPQDVLLEVVEENLDNITAELEVTIDGIERGVVEETANSSGGGLETWVIVVIVIVTVILLIAVIGITALLVIKGSKPRKNQVNDSLDDIKGNGKMAAHELH